MMKADDLTNTAQTIAISRNSISIVGLLERYLTMRHFKAGTKCTFELWK